MFYLQYVIAVVPGHTHCFTLVVILYIQKCLHLCCVCFCSLFFVLFVCCFFVLFFFFVVFLLLLFRYIINIIFGSNAVVLLLFIHCVLLFPLFV